MKQETYYEGHYTYFIKLAQPDHYAHFLKQAQ